MGRRKKKEMPKKRSANRIYEPAHFIVCLLSTFYYAYSAMFIFSRSVEHLKQNSLQWVDILKVPLISLEDWPVLLIWTLNDTTIFVVNVICTSRALLSENPLVTQHHVVLFLVGMIKSAGFVAYCLALSEYHPNGLGYHLTFLLSFFGFIAYWLLLGATHHHSTKEMIRRFHRRNK